MRILLVNNDTKHIELLSEALYGHELEVVEYRPGVKFNHKDKDLIVLSGGGGEGKEANDVHSGGKLWYKDEIDLIHQTEAPVLGICMGFEVICQAFGAQVQKMPSKVRGIKTIKTGNRKIHQVNIHDWHITSVPNELIIKGYSDTGIEIVEHANRPIKAVQFHPELGGSIKITDLLPYGLKA